MCRICTRIKKGGIGMINNNQGRNKQQTNRQQPTKAKKISMTTVIKNSIHYPKSRNGEALYVRVDQQPVKQQNSPTNIRAICLTTREVIIYYWGSVIIGGSKTNVKVGKYIVEGKPVDSLVSGKYTWDNIGLRGLLDPYVLSNLEELWISEDLLRYAQGGNINRYARGVAPGHVVDGSYLKGLLETEISRWKGNRKVEDTFPVLRSLVVFKEPVQRIKRPDYGMNRTDKVKQFLDNESRGKGVRLVVGESPKILRQLAGETGIGYAAYRLPGRILKFRVRDYQYDDVVLHKLRDELKAKYGIHKVKVEKEKAEEVKAEKEKAEEVKPKEVKQKVAKKVGEVEVTGKGSNEENLEKMLRHLNKSIKNLESRNMAVYSYGINNKELFRGQVEKLPQDLKEMYAWAISQVLK